MNSLPEWLKKRVVINDAFFETKEALSRFSVNTVCQSSGCPNIGECFSSGSATFMILGRTCTRNCSFCSVEKSGLPERVDNNEPARIADCVKRLGLKYAIVTSVTRDDLADGGAGQFVDTVKAVRQAVEGVRIELLIPDLAGDREPLESIALSGADVIGHNIETINRLYPFVRKEADYFRSLDVLKLIKQTNPKVLTKSAILAGLGETKNELIETMRDLRKVNCDILNVGQYLSPSKKHHPVQRFVTPEEFAEYKNIGEEIGFIHVSSAPFVRSSYHAEKGYLAVSGKS